MASVETNPALITHGPLFIGLILNIFLYGILVFQVHVYYVNYGKDRWWLKTMVALLLCADSAQSAFMVADLYDNLVLHFNDGKYLEVSTWVLHTAPVLTGLISATVQCYFAYRVRIITGKLCIALIIVGFSAITFLAALATTISAGILPAFAEWGRFQTAIILWLLSSSIADVLITSTLVFTLRKRKTGFKKMDSIVDRIIRLTVQTGLITAFVAVVDTIVFILVPRSGLHLIFNLPLCKLYTNSLLSSLNSREIQRKDIYDSSHFPGIIMSVDIPQRPTSVQLAPRQEPRVIVQVETDIAYDVPDSASQLFYENDIKFQAQSLQRAYLDMPYHGSGSQK